MKSKTKIIIAVFSVLILMISIVACGDGNQEAEGDITVNIGALRGPTGMGMAKLMDNSEKGDTALDYDRELAGSPDVLVGKIISGEVDIAAVPTNLALTLYNRTEGNVQLAAVNTLGVLYVLESGDSINSLSDLEGKTINVSGKGAAPDFILKYLLEENGLVPDVDVEIDFAIQHADLATAMVAGDVDLALLPQPHVTTALMRNEDLRIALDITEEWHNVMDGKGELAMGCIVVQKDFAENNKDELHKFFEEYQNSVEFVNNNIDEAGELIANFNLLPSPEIAKKAIPYSNIVYIEAMDAKEFLDDFYNVLYDFNPDSIGGQLADEGFYYQR